MTSHPGNGLTRNHSRPPSVAEGFSFRAGTPVVMPRRVLQLRRRAAEGYYDRPEIMAEIVRRLVESGDLPTRRA